MNFQPFHALSFIDYFLNAILWATAFSVATVLVTVILCLVSRDSDMGKAVGIMSIFSFAVVAYISCAVLTFDNAKTNHQIAFQNLSKKYAVESVTYEKSRRGFEPNADVEDPLNVIIKTQGKSRPAVITQNLQTFEPTLKDFDTGKPLDEILQK